MSLKEKLVSSLRQQVRGGVIVSSCFVCALAASESCSGDAAVQTASKDGGEALTVGDRTEERSRPNDEEGEAKKPEGSNAAGTGGVWHGSDNEALPKGEGGSSSRDGEGGTRAATGGTTAGTFAAGGEGGTRAGTGGASGGEGGTSGAAGTFAGSGGEGGTKAGTGGAGGTTAGAGGTSGGSGGAGGTSAGAGGTSAGTGGTSAGTGGTSAGTGGAGGTGGGTGGTTGKPCTKAADCNDGLYCSGTEICTSAGVCAYGAAPCQGQRCVEATKSCSTPTATQTVTLNAATTYQTMVGWEATAEAGEFDSPKFDMYKDRLFPMVAELGITRLRVSVPNGIEGAGEYEPPEAYHVVNDDSDPNHINWAGFNFSKLDQLVTKVVLPLKALVEANHEKFFVNVNYVSFNSKYGDPNATNPAEYAEFVLAIHKHLKSTFNLDIDAWEVVLEPEHDAPFTGTNIGKAMVKTAAVLAANGFPNRKFIAPSNTDINNAISYYDSIIAVPGAKALLGEFSYHRYRPLDQTQFPAALQAIRDRSVRDKIGTAMLEHIGSGVDDLYQDLTVALNVSWQQFVVAYNLPQDDGSKYFAVDDTVSPPTITMMSRTKLLRQYFKFIRPGAVRFLAQSNDTQVKPVAFKNQNGKSVVVVRTDAPKTFVIKGLPGSLYGVKYTTPQEYNRDLPDQPGFSGQSVVVQIPQAGVITIYGK